MRAVATAHPNIALVKYWGKRDKAINLPAVGSISITLDTLTTRTVVDFDGNLGEDEFWMGSARVFSDEPRVARFLGLVRERAGLRKFARVQSENNFPTGAGLASSASGFAALAVAATAACGLRLSPHELSVLARCGSGSAPRSLHGGFVEMKRGDREDGSDSFAEPVAEASHWPLRVLVAITSEKRKSTGSTDGMERSRATSPFYSAWIASSTADLDAARHAVQTRDFAQLAEVAEHSCLKMHGLSLSSRPPILYWNPTTFSLIQTILELRSRGVPVFFTIDAGPQVKAVCLPEAAERIRVVLAEVPGVKRMMMTGLGGGAALLDEPR